MAPGVLLLTLLLLIGFLSTRIASAVRVPHSVFLVILGLFVGLVSRHYAALWNISIFPDLVLYVLLPPLVFDSAYHLDLRQLREDLVPISALAVIGLVVSTACIGYALHALFGISLTSALIFGSLISATDPVAVVALFREVGAPKRLETLIDGEALLNDGTAMVLFRIFVALALAPQSPGYRPNLLPFIGGHFLAVTLGSVLAGLAMSAIVSFLLRLSSTSPAAQLGVTVTSAYLTFIVADYFLGVSGVIATLIVGLYLGWRARIDLDAAAYEGMTHVWGFLSLSANALVFLAVGMTVQLSPLTSHLGPILLAIAVVYVARAISVFTVIPLINRVPYSRPISWTYALTLVWGGLRGGLPLGLVLALPEALPEKHLFLLLATSVVIATLLVNAQTTRRILALLKLDQLDPAEERLYLKTIADAESSGFASLEAIAKSRHLSETLIEAQKARLHAFFSEREPRLERGDQVSDPRLALRELVLWERQFYDDRLGEGAVSRGAYSRATQSVSERLDLLAERGPAGIASYSFADSRESARLPRLVSRMSPRKVNRLSSELAERLETLLIQLIALEQGLATTTDPPTREIAQKWVTDLDRTLATFGRVYAHYFPAAQARFISNSIHARARHTLNLLRRIGLINQAVFAKASARAESFYQDSLQESRHLLRPSAAYLLARIPIFREIPRVAVRQLTDLSRTQVFSSGESLAGRRKAVNRGLLLIVAGSVELFDPAQPSAKSRTLFAGDFIGLETLFHERSSKLLAQATMTTEVLEIDPAVFRQVMSAYPTILARLTESAAGA